MQPLPLTHATTLPASTALHPSLWRGDQLGTFKTPCVSSFFNKLDAELPGNGWPTGVVTELITREPGIGEIRLLIPALRQLTREKKTVIFLGAPHIPYAPALASFGIDLKYLLIVQANQAADRLWAVEQTLKSASFGALLAWLPKAQPTHLRRMQLAANSAQGPVFLFRPLSAQFESSPAPLRLLLQAKPDQRMAIHILKRRGPVIAQPILIDLPQPMAAIELKPSAKQIASIHSHPKFSHPLSSSHTAQHEVHTATH
jgi:protein ImuA